MMKEILKLELEAFQGPFDLLLHLIKELKVDINDIPMTEITEQYIFYLKNMQELELDIAGEYLVMASTLLEIKARMLLPIEPIDNLDDEYEGDPREILVQQLLMYQQFQQVATALEVKESERSHVFTRPAEDLSKFEIAIPLKEHELSLAELTDAFYLALQRQLARVPKERHIEHDPLTVSQKIDEITGMIQNSNTNISFLSLIKKGTRHEIITTFMAVLEMVRKQSIVFFQATALAPITIKWIKQ